MVNGEYNFKIKKKETESEVRSTILEMQYTNWQFLMDFHPSDTLTTVEDRLWVYEQWKLTVCTTNDYGWFAIFCLTRCYFNYLAFTIQVDLLNLNRKIAESNREKSGGLF